MSLIDRAKKYVKDKGGLFASGSFDILFFVFLVAIIVVGLTMLYSATYVYAAHYSKDGDPATYFKNQLFGVVLEGVHAASRPITNIMARSSAMVFFMSVFSPFVLFYFLQKPLAASNLKSSLMDFACLN